MISILNSKLELALPLTTKMRRPLVTERYVLAEHSPNRNVRKDPDDSEAASKTIKECTSRNQMTLTLIMILGVMEKYF